MFQDHPSRKKGKNFIVPNNVCCLGLFVHFITSGVAIGGIAHPGKILRKKIGNLKWKAKFQALTFC
jgi:hypothetical protein